MNSDKQDIVWWPVPADEKAKAFEADFGRSRVARYERNEDDVTITAGEAVLKLTRTENFGHRIDINLSNSFIGLTSRGSREPRMVWIVLTEGRPYLVEVATIAVLVIGKGGGQVLRTVRPWKDGHTKGMAEATITDVAPNVPWPDLGILAGFSIEAFRWPELQEPDSGLDMWG